MEKPALLRAAIVAVLPELGTDPQRLRMFIEKGRIRSRMTASHGFEWAYTLTVVVTDFTQHPDLLFLAINDWVRVQQPDLLTPGGDDGYSFEADILDSNAVDLQVELALTEQVRLVPRTGGGYDLQHLAEQVPLLPDDAPLTDPVALLRQIWWKGELLVE